MALNFSIESILRHPFRQADDESNAALIKITTEQFSGTCQSQEVNESTLETKPYSWLQTNRYNPPKLARGNRTKQEAKDLSIPKLGSNKTICKIQSTGTSNKFGGRSPRIPFSKFQVSSMESKFHRCRYLSSVDVSEISQELNLSETRVKIWFQNRRARERREAKPESEFGLDEVQSPDGTPGRPLVREPSSPIMRMMFPPPNHPTFLHPLDLANSDTDKNHWTMARIHPSLTNAYYHRGLQGSSSGSPGRVFRSDYASLDHPHVSGNYIIDLPQLQRLAFQAAGHL